MYRNSIGAIFVDWYKTLSISEFWNCSANNYLTPLELLRVERYVFSRPDLVRKWMIGTIASEDVCAAAASALKLSPEHVLADLAESCRAMELYDPSVLETLKSMTDRGTKVVLATDNMDTFARWTVPALGLDTCFDAILTSHACRAMKADLIEGYSPFFSPWLSERRIEPAAAVLVDDCAVPAAEAIGMTFRLVEHPGDLAGILRELVAGECSQSVES